MLDFLVISTRMTKNTYEVYPKFIVKRSKDLMIRGSAFYAIWDDASGLWSTDEYLAIQLIDSQVDDWVEKNRESLPPNARILHLWDAESGLIDKWNRYCQNQMRDNFVQLDDLVVFSNQDTTREDYASKKLLYPLAPCDILAWNTLIGTLYDKEERRKIEWAIGAIFTGEAAKIQKFVVFYGAPGTGKSTIMDIIQLLFDGYYSMFNAKDLTSNTNAFALDAFRNNPLVSIQHDGDLSRIEDNTKLNSLVSHEYMTVNEKYRSSYVNRFRTFLFMGTNKPVKITDSKSGLLRRLIDIHPTGKLIPYRQYVDLMSRIPFELGGIAAHCIDVFKADPDAYNDYVPLRMMDASNDFYNFLHENYYALSKADGISLKDAWEMYKQYCQDSNVVYPFSKRVFKEEMKSYFKTFFDRNPDGRHQRDWYSGLIKEKFPDMLTEEAEKTKPNTTDAWLTSDSLVEQPSLLDEICKDCPAQYANKDEIPSKAWDKVKTTLKDLDTKKLHYALFPGDHIMIDCDLRDADGNKDLVLNINYAKSLPPTYCEVSKSGGLHLHYIYKGDVTLLKNEIDPHIEIKKCTGKSAIRRRLTRCNNLQITTISSGLPMKGEKRVVNMDVVMTEGKLRNLVLKNLKKEIHGDTRSSIDFIKKLLDEACDSGVKYDLRDLQNDVYNFASRSTNQASYCMEVCTGLKFYSGLESIGDEGFINELQETEGAPLCFFDIEIFPNVFILCYKVDGENNSCVRLINPSPDLVRDFIRSNMKKIGFNNRRYDNHLIYAYAYRNYSVFDLFKLSGHIINSRMSKYFIGEAYNISYTDIYDFASAKNKKSLKKLEIEMGIHHKEFEHPWDKPLAEELWEEAADYCCNDVVATEAAFHYLEGDFLARLILADIANMTPNNTTNQLSTRIIFGTNKTPQGEFNYRNLAAPVRPGSPFLDNMGERKFRLFNEQGLPTYQDWDGEDIPEGWSLLPFFPGYTYEFGVSTYKDTAIGEGGYVYAEPGMYRYISLLDVASMHPSSVLAECLFGPMYTGVFKSIIDLRLDIKHNELEKALTLFDGRLEKWLNNPKYFDALADALKTVIVSVYGMTSAKYENPFHDVRNVDNIVAKRGALFMRTLQDEVQKKGFTVAHIKTDSIKIPDATPELIDFVMKFGLEYGYTFEYEAKYDCMTLVNDAVYIARYDAKGIQNKGGKKAGQWTATGKQFAVPYVFKTLFTHEDLAFNDLCETFAVKTAIYLDVNEQLEDVSQLEKELKKLDRENPDNANAVAELKEGIAKGHNYCFIGRTGRFCPINPGNGGGILYRLGTDKCGDPNYASLSGTSGRRWMDAEQVVELEKQNEIDMGYFEKLADDARKAIEAYGGFDWFVNHDLNDPVNDILPF